MKRRKLTPGERMHLAATRHFPPYTVQVFIEGEGRLSVEELGSAMERVAAANPGLRWKRRGSWWVEGACPPVREASCLDAARREKMDPAARTCELVVLPGGLLFRACHALVDGSGLLFWAAELFRVLRGEPPQGTNSAISDRDFLHANGKPGRPPMRCLHRSPFAGGEGFAWVEKSAPAGDHAFVAKALAGVCREKGGTFMIPVDMRRFGGMRTTGNMTNMLFLKVEAGAAWEEIHRSLLGLLERDGALLRDWRELLLAVAPVPVVARAMKVLHRFAVRWDRYLVSGGVSHLGTVRTADFSAAGFAAKRLRPMPFDAAVVGFFLVSLNHDSGLELALSVPGNADAAVHAWLDDLCGTREVCGPVRPVEGDPYRRFLGVVERVPEAVAAVHGDERITYRELERRAAAFHGAMREKGVRAGERVAVQLPHSVDLLVALLGSLRGGNPFVPLDPSWPEARVGKVVADGGARLVIRGEIPGASSFPAPEITDTAYLIYTSGSTGEPKGVKVGRRSFLNFLLWAEETFGQGVSAPLFGSIAFDATLIAVFVPLMSGGAVWIPRERELGGAVREILASPVDLINLTPSHLRLFLENGFRDSKVRWLISGGESFPVELARRVLEQRRMAIFNVYGPTEATVGCVVHEFDPEKDTGTTIPIGLPIRNTRAVLRGGELLLGGLCLAEGYEGLPPFGELYATGDLVSWDGGKLHCHGRSDDQMKVRGQRIEPAEVEAAILSSGWVSACVVRAERNKLIAFLVWKNGGDAELLREHLERELPRGWIPDFFHALDALPVSANGKVDGKALVMRFPVVEAEAAATALETELLAMAAEILEVPAGGVSKDRPLHEMGFDSLQLLLLLTRASRRYRPDAADFGFLDADFFKSPTIASLAAALGG